MSKSWIKGITAILILGLGIQSLAAQENGQLSEESRTQIETIEDTLAILGFTIINDSIPEERFAACRKMITSLVQALKEENSFEYPFDRLKNISIQYPQDSSFRIFSWQLYVDQNDYRYYGAVQMNTSELTLFPLIDRSYQVEKVEKEILPPEKWYGAVYYNIKQLNGPNGKYYLLFGYDGFEFFRKRKVLEVLSFDHEGKPVFGAPVFEMQVENHTPEVKNRLCLEYSAEASVRLNYDAALGVIVFDHLILMGGQYGEGPVYVPDGSYEGFRIENGELVHVPKIWDQVQEEPPRPMPILDQRSRDIMGNRQ